MVTVEEVMAKVREFFSDTTRSRGETREGLIEIRGEIHELIDALDEDDRRDARDAEEDEG